VTSGRGRAILSGMSFSARGSWAGESIRGAFAAALWTALAASCTAAPEASTGDTDTSEGEVSTSASEASTAASEASTAASTSGTGASTDAPTTGSGPDLPPARLCNGDAALCERRFDEVAFPCTHNAFAALDEGFAQFNANQNHGVAQQLADGVRCMMLDVTEDAGETALCHGPCTFGRLDHLEVLLEIAAFLDAHPDEVLTFIYQDDVEAERIVADLEDSGLAARVYTHAPGEPWPTLAAMIDADTRLLVTAENGGPPPAWFHHVWDLSWDTPYSFHSVDEFSCALNRGQLGNDLFLVNHWISSVIDLPSQMDAKIVNVFDVLHGRAAQCQKEAGQLPNFLAVDFYEHGDLIAAVRALNGLP